MKTHHIIFCLLVSTLSFSQMVVNDPTANSNLAQVNMNLNKITSVLNQNLEQIKSDSKKQTNIFTGTADTAKLKSKASELVVIITDLYCLFQDIDFYTNLAIDYNINFNVCTNNLNYDLNIANIKNATKQAITSITSKEMTLGERLLAIDSSFKNVNNSTSELIEYKDDLEKSVKTKQFNNGLRTIKF